MHFARRYNNSMSTAEPSPSAANPRRFRWRRPFQYRLRTLLILMTACAVLFAWWSQKVRQARQQRAAVAAIEAADGQIWYDLRRLNIKSLHYWPEWLVNALGVDYFAKVKVVSFFHQHLNPTNEHNFANNSQVTDAVLENLKGLTELQVLYIIGIQVTDAGLEHLKGLKTLQELSVLHTQVTDAGLQHLQGLTALQELSLSGTQVTGAGLPHLRELTALKGIYLGNTQVTDAGLEHLKGMTALKELGLRGTQVTDAGVARLQQALPNCEIER